MLHAGDVLAGRYRLRARVGGGGMGDVWRGEDTVLGRTVAVKVLRASLADERNFRERFRREARAIAALEGAGIVDVYDYGEELVPDGTIAYLIMQFVDGMALSRRLAGWGRMNTQDTLRIVAQVADALDTAHRSGIVHRDVKPGNILVRSDGRVVLVDFGIARTDAELTMTTTGVVLGTVTYMSPEQASGQKLGPASDIYSLGVVAHQCLAGDPPFQADTPLGVLSAHLRNIPPRLPSDVPRPVPELISRALAKEPGERWPSAAQFAEACRQAGTERFEPVPEFAGAVAAPRVRRPGPAVVDASPPFTGTELPEIEFDAPLQRSSPLPVPHDTPRRGIPRRESFETSSRVLTHAPVVEAEAPHTAPPPRSTPPSPRPTPTFEATPSKEVALPPPTPPADEPDADPAPRRRRGRLALAMIALVAALLVTAAVTVWPVDRIGDSERATSEQESKAADSDDGYDGDETGPGGQGGDDSDNSSKKKKKKTDSPGGDGSQESTPSASSSDASTPPETVAVPNVLNKSEADARRAVTDARLRPAIIYEGEGEHTCTVTTQEPSGGRQAEPGSTVTITVRKAKEGCEKR